MMRREDFFKAIDEGGFVAQHFNEDAINEGFAFFAQDAATDCEYFATFQKFYSQLFVRNKTLYYHQVHLVMMQYILAYENMPATPPSVLGYLYLCEAEYYIGVNVYSECIRNIFNALELPSLNAEYVASGLTMLLTLLWDNGVTTQAIKYINSLELLLETKKLPPLQSFLAACALMEAHSVLGNADKSDYYANYIQNEIDRTQIDDAYFSVFSCTQLSCSVRKNPDTVPSAQFIAKLKSVIKEFETLNINDSFSYTFLPLFRYIQGYVSEATLIRMVESMLALSRSTIDQLSFYDYMIDEMKIRQERYPEIFNNYYTLLRHQHVVDRDNRKQIIESEMLSYELTSKYKKSAITDTLTGIGSRLAYTNRLDTLAHQRGGLPANLCLVMMDVNGLKERNDSRGHDAGDSMLKTAASLIKANFSDIGTIYRIGGDEFAALVTATRPELEATIKEFRACCAAYDSLAEEVSISLGYSLLSEFEDVSGAKNKLNAMTQTADDRMYHDKEVYYNKTGKDRRKR